MGQINSCFKLRLPHVFMPFLIILSGFFLPDFAGAITASVGQPYHGRLVNGVPFPNQFQGYDVRDEERSYATPELIGALLDALDAVRQQDPNTCDLFIGDFSRAGGGPLNHHRSHQNGRDVDLGMFVKGNREVSTFLPMNGENLDVPKTWILIENLLRSQRIQYIFVDKRIQNLLYDYALCRGVDPNYLDQLFGGGRNSIIRHIGNHHDHIHVRFYAPWSTMAAQVSETDEQKRTIIEMAQQAYLPKKVNYYVKGTEPSLDALAHSFGVNRKDLSRWNQVHGNEALRPGSCLVFYKRGFEMEPVRLAQSLQPNAVPETPFVQMASLRSLRSVSDAPVSVRDSRYSEKRNSLSTSWTYTVRKGETLRDIARKHKMDVRALAELNGFKKKYSLRAGQKIKVVDSKSHLILVDDNAYTAAAKTCDPRTVRITRGNGAQVDNAASGDGGFPSLGKSASRVRIARAAQADQLVKSNPVVSDAVPSASRSKTSKLGDVAGKKNRGRVDSSGKGVSKPAFKVDKKSSGSNRIASVSKASVAIAKPSSMVSKSIAKNPTTPPKAPSISKKSVEEPSTKIKQKTAGASKETTSKSAGAATSRKAK